MPEYATADDLDPATLYQFWKVHDDRIENVIKPAINGYVGTYHVLWLFGNEENAKAAALKRWQRDLDRARADLANVTYHIDRLERQISNL